MKLIIIFGPQAVGKMTVGYELEKLTGIPLFHNHMTIDLVSPFFGYGSETGKKLVHEFRFRIFEEVSKSNNKGIIFTYLWAFDEKGDKEYIDKIIQIFARQNVEAYLIELEADLKTRLKRNTHEFRLEKKPTKRNIEFSTQDLINDAKNHRLNSLPGELPYKNYLRINNTNIFAKDTAKMIQKYFSF